MRKPVFRVACLVLGLGVAPAAALAAPEAKGTLDGKTFVGETGEKGKTKADRDTLHFTGGRFHSTACDAYGFSEAPYTATPRSDGTLEWSSETTSEKEGKIHWKGTVKGDVLTGTLVWTKAGQAPIEYWVKASAQK